MGDEDLETKLSEELDFLGINLPPKLIIRKCADICAIRNYDADEFCEKWLSFSMFQENKTDTTPNAQSLEQFERFLDEQLEKQKKKDLKTSKSSKIIIQNISDPGCSTYTEKSTEKISTPKRHREEYETSSAHVAKKPKEIKNENNTPILDSSVSQSLYASQMEDEMSENVEEDLNLGPDKVVQTYGIRNLKDKATFKSQGIDKKLIILISPETETLNANTLLYYNPRSDKRDIMSKRIDYISNFLLNKYKLEEPEAFITLSNQSGEKIVCGRIFKKARDKQTNNSMLLLESSIKSQEGERSGILNLNLLSGAALFPGQILAASASQAGKQVKLSKVYSDATLDLPEIIPKISSSGPLQIVVAAGPFTMDVGPRYHHLEELITYVVHHMPHILILLGPFLDVEQEHLLNNSVSYDTHFQILIRKIMNNLEDKQCNTKVIIISSHRDIHHDNVYPTPPYFLEETYKNLQFLPDPCVFSINGLFIGATSTDVLSHMRQETVFLMNRKEEDRLNAVVKNLISQQCFYPLYPAPKGMCLDLNLLSKHAFFEETPHVLILPSTIRHFVREIEGCVVINPSKLSKSSSSGTFARMEVHPNQISKTAADNIVCQILKI